jgi:hypothetical protein
MDASPSRGAVKCRTVIFPTSPPRVPPPRNRISKLEKTTVGAKITGLRGVPGKISGNHLVITAPDVLPLTRRRYIM